MFKDVFSNRLFIGALVFFVLMIAGGTLYIKHVERQEQLELERTEERLKQWEARQKTPPKVPEGDTEPGRHLHADGTWHDKRHEPVGVDRKVPNDVVDIPDYIYAPDRKKPTGWDPNLVFETGDKKIDLNYRPLTEEEQAEYERLKRTLVPPEDYGITEAGLRIIAIGNIFRQNTPEFLDSLDTDITSGKSQEEIDAKVREFNGIFAN